MKQAQAEYPGRVLALTRAGIAVLLILAIANGVFLYFFPAQAEPDYAWPIKPPISAAFIGAGYLAGMVAGALGLFATRSYASVRALVPGFCVLGITLLAATLIDADRFRWDYSLTWAWTAIYALVAPAAIYLWLRQRRLAPDADDPENPVPASLRPLSWALGAVMAAVGVVLFVAPDWLLEDWPWPITPLIARVFAGWYLLSALTLLYSALTARRARELPIPYMTVATWGLLTLLVLPLYSESVRSAAAGYWPFVVLHALLIAFCAFAVVRSLALMRAAGQRL